MIPRTAERPGHYYVRHGTIGLSAATDTAAGKVIGQLSARHRAVDFRDFPGQIDRQTEPGLAIHVICDLCQPRDHADTGWAWGRGSLRRRACRW